MPHGLIRSHGNNDDHFLTFSCYRREAYFADSPARDVFEDALERTRRKYDMAILAYVVMPEHVHLLVSEPWTLPLSRAIQSLKISVAKRLAPRPFWQTRYYDFNVRTHRKRVEKIRYIHRNPVLRGLAARPQDWAW